MSYQPMRMCIVCRNRMPQRNLLRFMLKEGVACFVSARARIMRHTSSNASIDNAHITHNNGRGFYLCDVCVMQEKGVLKALGRIKKLEHVAESLRAIQQACNKQANAKE